MSRRHHLFVAVLTVSSASLAQTPEEVSTWLTGIGAKISARPPTVEAIAKATSVSFDGPKEKLVVGDLVKLKGIKGLKDVGFSNKSATDALVAELVKVVPTLEAISIHYSGITDASFVELAKLPKLKKIVAFDTQITDAAMVSISKLTSLESLEISNTKVGDAGLEALKGSNLKTLAFNSMKGVTKKGLAAIAAMPKLADLSLASAELNGEVEELVKSKGLKKLTVMSSTIDDVGGVWLGKIKTLESLFVWSTKVGDKTMESLSALPRLRVLYLSKTPTTDEGMKALAKIPTLEVLWFDHTDIGDKGIAAFAKHPKIQWMLAEETKVTDAAVPSLLTMPALKTFGAKKSAVTEAGIKALLEKSPKGHFTR